MKTRYNPGRAGVEGSAYRVRPGRLVWFFGMSLAVLMAALHPLQAKETNEVNEEATVKKKVFTFDGGTPIDFVVALDRHFRTRLVQILTLPETLSRTKVPKLRVAAEDPREVLAVYNRLQSPTLGQWRFDPEGTAPQARGTNLNALVLVPDKSVVASRVERSLTKVKALALAGVPEGKWDGLMRDINEARSYGEKVAANGASEVLEGSVRLQRDSKVLIVAGSEAYIEMVDSMVSAHRMNAEIESRAGAAAPKNPVGGQENK